MKQIILMFKDMFKDYSIARLIGCSLLPLIAMLLVYFNLSEFLDFTTLAHKFMTIILIIIEFWLGSIFLGFFISLLARIYRI